MKIGKRKGSKIHHLVTEDIYAPTDESPCGQFFLLEEEFGDTVVETTAEAARELVQAGTFCKRCAKHLEAHIWREEEFPRMVRSFDGETGLMDFPLFHTEIEFSIDSDDVNSDTISYEYLYQCAEHLKNLPENVINILCEASIRYCEDMRENADFGSMGFPVPENIAGRKILQYIHPKSLIMEPQEYNAVVLHLELDCDWEPEHGMEWIIRENEVLYVSSFDWEHPWREKEYFKNMEGNYAIID